MTTAINMNRRIYNRVRRKRVTILTLCLVLAHTTALASPDLDAVGVVNTNIVHQKLEGFGASGAWYEGWLTSHPLRNQIYSVLFGQLGLDIYRVRNTYGTDTSYITRSAQIIQAAKSSLGHPIKVMISSWSPPASLKSNGSTVGGTLAKDTHGYYKYSEFARWWADSLVDYSSRGINADYVNMQNEPDYEASWDSCLFAPSETTSRAGYNKAFEAVYQELNSRMSELPKLLAPEACGMRVSANYIKALIDNSHAYGWAHHLYADGSCSAPDGYIAAMANFAAQYGNKPLLQTEFGKGDSEPLTFTDAMNLAILMHNSLTVEGASAYLYWELFWAQPKGLVSLDNPWQSNASYTINHPYYAFKHYSAFTDPNWHRVEASTDSSGLRISAFKSPDSTVLSVVVINVSTTDIDLSLSLEGFSPDGSGVYRTSETQHAAYVGTFDESQSLTFPARTITTISLTGTPYFSNCAEVLAAGYGLTSDINCDCHVNYRDLDILIDYWLTTGCDGFNNCGGADFEPDGDVDLVDFGTLAVQWMQCNDPQEPDCTPNW